MIDIDELFKVLHNNNLEPLKYRVSIEVQTGHGWESTFWFFPSKADKSVIEDMMVRYCHFE